jgi:hypothetical protein
VQRDDGCGAATAPRTCENASGLLEPLGVGAEAGMCGCRDTLQGSGVVEQGGA